MGSKGLDEQRLWIAVMLVGTFSSLREGAQVVTRETYRGSEFQMFCESAMLLHDAGLSRVREFKKGRDGRFVEISFETVLTEAGKVVRAAPPKPLEIDAETKAGIRRHLELAAATGISGSELIDNTGRVVGVMENFFTSEQIKEQARSQLAYMDELEGKAKDRSKP